MNKNELKDLYLKGAMESFLKNQVEYYLPSHISEKVLREFRANINKELAEIEQRAEEYATKVTS